MKKISDVLKAAGFGTEALEAWGSQERLDQIPNLREMVHSTTRWHTPWKVISEPCPVALPDFRTFVTLHSWEVTRHPSSQGELWDGNEVMDAPYRTYQDWLLATITGDGDAKRVLNLETSPMISTPNGQLYKDWAIQLIHRYAPNHDPQLSLVVGSLTANINPRGTMTEVHHDTSYGISTVVGCKNKEYALKLWIVWPSTHVDRLASCYNNTRKALGVLEDPRFLVQMPGETVFVPPSSPHAVFTLNDSYLPGVDGGAPDWAMDPCTAAVLFRAGGTNSISNALRHRLGQLRKGLASPYLPVRQAYVDHLVSTWGWDSDMFRSNGPAHRELIIALTKEIERTGLCVWCEFVGNGLEHDIRDPDHVKDVHCR